MSETAVAFARLCLCGVETAVAFARSCSCGIETVIAFAGAKCVFLAHFSGAEVSSVSVVPCWGRAVVMVVSMGVVQGRALVMVVSRWPASVAVEVSLVASSPRGCVLCAKKFAQRTKNGPKSASCGVLGEIIRGNAAGRVV